MHVYAVLLGVEVQTHCTMSNHFHILLRVPERPEGETGAGGPSVEQLLVRLEAAVGGDQMKQIRQNLRMCKPQATPIIVEIFDAEPLLSSGRTRREVTLGPFIRDPGRPAVRTEHGEADAIPAPREGTAADWRPQQGNSPVTKKGLRC